MYDNDRRRRSGAPSIAVLSLLLQLFEQLQRSSYTPPVTVALLGINILVHLHPDPSFLGHSLTSIRANCLHPAAMLYAWTRYGEVQWHRLLLSAVMHADDRHLYYNMLSLCWKGIHLEKALGSYSFLWLVVFSWIASHSLLILLASALHFALGLDRYASGFDVCAVGFSAVLFSLKYVLNATSDGHDVVMGVRVPTRHAAWLELVAISLVSPHASFLGHLSGILAGVLYLHGPLEVLLFLPRWAYGLGRKLFSSRAVEVHDDEPELEEESPLRERQRDRFYCSDPLDVRFPDEQELRAQRLRHLVNRRR